MIFFIKSTSSVWNYATKMELIYWMKILLLNGVEENFQKKYENFLVSCTSLESERPTKKDEFRIKIVIPVLDIIIQELNDRFTDNDSILRAMECFSPTSDKFLSYSQLEPAAKHYKFDVELLETQLRLLPKTIELYEKEKKIKISSTMMLLDFLEVYKNAFWEVYNLCIISITIPVSSAGCERTFSCLRFLKNYLRNAMHDDRLCNLAVLYIEKKLAKSLNLDLVVEKFANLNNRRMMLY